jgi:hypothetical protein
MNAMNMPGFTAAAALFKSTHQYASASNVVGRRRGKIVPQAKPVWNRCIMYCFNHGGPLACYDWCDRMWGD